MRRPYPTIRRGDPMEIGQIGTFGSVNFDRGLSAAVRATCVEDRAT
jgi:hypothetical protein